MTPMWHGDLRRPAISFTFAITAFWAAYVLIRPLGDLLSPRLGPAGTSLVFLGVVAYLSVSRRDQPSLEAATIRARSAW